MVVPALIFKPIIQQRQFSPSFLTDNLTMLVLALHFLTNHSSMSVPALHFSTDHLTMLVPALIFNQSFDNVGSIVSPLCVFLWIVWDCRGGKRAEPVPALLILYSTAIIPAPLRCPRALSPAPPPAPSTLPC
jgi:hypothetical protein